MRVFHGRKTIVGGVMGVLVGDGLVGSVVCDFFWRACRRRWTFKYSYLGVVWPSGDRIETRDSWRRWLQRRRPGRTVVNLGQYCCRRCCR